LIKTFSGHQGPCNHCDLSYDNQYLISSSSRLQIILHDFKSGKELDRFQIAPYTEPKENELIEEPERIKIEKNRPEFSKGWVKQPKKKSFDPAFIWSCDFTLDNDYKFLSSSNNGIVKY